LSFVLVGTRAFPVEYKVEYSAGTSRFFAYVSHVLTKSEFASSKHDKLLLRYVYIYFGIIIFGYLPIRIESFEYSEYSIIIVMYLYQ